MLKEWFIRNKFISQQWQILGKRILAFVAWILLTLTLSHCTANPSNPLRPNNFSSKSYNIETTEMFLQFLSENPETIQLSSELGQKLQSRAIIQYLFDEYPDCWQSLQSKLKESGHSYALAAGENGNIPNPRDVDDSYVAIRFPDGYQAKLFFYQSRVVGCRITGD